MVTGAGCELGGLARLASDPGAGRPRRRDCRQDQVWVSGDWARRFGLDADPSNSGYGHSAEQVATVRPESFQVLIDYYDAVAARTRDLLHELTPKDLDQIVDLRWDPPVTLGVRLVSVADDDLQHVGQAAYVRGLLAAR